jgi:ABC-type sugar transport system ATPase subunit
LSEHEATHLYDLVGRLTARGVTLLYVSHRMYELFQLCDTVTVLRDGQHVATRPTAEYTEAEIVRLMVGRTVEGYVRSKAATAADAAPAAAPKSVTWPPRLRVQGLHSPGKFEDVSFSVAPGEIVGLAGLIGAGRTEVMEALFGLDPAARGHLRIDDVEVTVRSPREAMRHAMGLVPEDRKRQGMVLSLSGRENLALPTLERLSNFLWVSQPRERAVATHYFSQLNVRAPGIETMAATLSGGNQQKIVLAKWLAARCRILLLDEPTRGVDVAAKAEIHALIDGLARDGVAIVLVSSELPELLSLADRVLVMRQGRIVTELVDTDQPTVLRWMAGVEA